MEKDKYYTPSIEEFHVGFEYERLESHRVYYQDNAPIKQSWNKKKWSSKETRIGNLECMITAKEIRVKYLDKEDIESLGFEYIRKDIERIVFHYKSYKLVLFKNNNHILISDDPYSAFLFKGIIKNKSELKKLLEQLNIK